MALRRMAIEALEIEDEASFRHVAIYAALKRALVHDGVQFAAPEPGPIATDADTLLLNLAFYKPGGVAEILVDEHISADQLAHSAWHHVVARHLGDHAAGRAALLLAESIASAADVYWVGRLLGHAPDSTFLATQVPAMADAALDAGMSEDEFQTLLERTSSDPEGVFESLRSLLFDTALALTDAPDADAAAAVLADVQDHPLAALLHHYELAGWVLYTRAHHAHVSDEPALHVHRMLMQCDDAVAWLEAQLL